MTQGTGPSAKGMVNVTLAIPSTLTITKLLSNLTLAAGAGSQIVSISFPPTNKSQLPVVEADQDDANSKRKDKIVSTLPSPEPAKAAPAPVTALTDALTPPPALASAPVDPVLTLLFFTTAPITALHLPPDIPTNTVWYVVTKGLAVGVYNTWMCVSPLVTSVSGATYQKASNKHHACIAFNNTLALDLVKLL